ALQRDMETKTKGPSKSAAYDGEGKPTRAAQAFAKKHDLSLEQLKLERFGKKEYLVAVQSIPGQKTVELLAKLLPAFIKGLVFPRNMVWEENRAKFARPIRWLLCLFGNAVIEFSYAGLSSGRETRGHRFTNPGPFVIDNPSHYFSCLGEAGVILDQEKRKSTIKEKVMDAAHQLGGEAHLDPELLQEVTFLVENPRAIPCSYPQDYLDLPREVLVTTMQGHQRYFPVEDTKGALRPSFIAVSNNASAPLDIIRRGNEKVLRARLADARFFYDEDAKVSLQARVDGLKNILFQENLGTLYEKTERLQGLAKYLLEKYPVPVDAAVQESTLRAAFLAKADLTTNMVDEFPELQGIMGREYSLKSGETPGKAEAIYEHYLPRFAGDAFPSTIPGIIVALADKIDHLAGCFAVGIRPSGSQDPYALRRQTLGILSILLHHKLSLSFDDLVRQALLLLQGKLNHLGKEEIEKLTREVRQFAWQRLRYLFQEEGIDYDIIEAVLDTPLDNVTLLQERARFLQGSRGNEDLKEAAQAFVRVANLARKATPGLKPSPELLKENEEKQLYAVLVPAGKKARLALEKGDLGTALETLVDLKKPIDLFFDQILVMAEDVQIRDNRLALLNEISVLFRLVADFSKIVF
ncbi:MAG: glycine--tRNA ligase subunit beta, partial [Dethiobacteria bacterium]